MGVGWGSGSGVASEPFKLIFSLWSTEPRSRPGFFLRAASDGRASRWRLGDHWGRGWHGRRYWERSDDLALSGAEL